MAYTKQDTEALEEQVARIRAKRNGDIDKEKLRKILNVLFIVIAVIGVCTYFYFKFVQDDPQMRWYGIYITGAGMVIKVAEFIVRLML